jgi:hypothetical protein
MPSLEESPLQVLNIDPEANCLVQVPDEINVSNVQACCRPALAMFCESGR